MRSSNIRLLAVLGLTFVSASSAVAQNSMELIFSRIDDFANPTDLFSAQITVNLLSEVGVTGVTVNANGFPITLVELPPPNTGVWEDPGGLTFVDLAEFKTQTGGPWSVTVTKANPSVPDSVSTFTFTSTSLVGSDFFATATGLTPANGATNVSMTSILSWGDPTGIATPFVLSVDALSGMSVQEALSVPSLGVADIPLTATSWQPPMALPNGFNEFSVFYGTLPTNPATLISPFTVSTGSIVWGSSGFAPAGYPLMTPLLALGSESDVSFTVPEPSASLAAVAALAALMLLARRSRREPATD